MGRGDHDALLARIREESLPEEAYDWYLDLRKYGTYKHSGIGLGVERTVAWIYGSIPSPIPSMSASGTKPGLRS